MSIPPRARLSRMNRETRSELRCRISDHTRWDLRLLNFYVSKHFTEAGFRFLHLGFVGRSLLCLPCLLVSGPLFVLIIGDVLGIEREIRFVDNSVEVFHEPRPVTGSGIRFPDLFHTSHFGIHEINEVNEVGFRSLGDLR